MPTEEMNKFKASDGLAIAYALDDYTDPWKPADTVILVHAAMGSSKRFYAWVPHLARESRVVRIDMRGGNRNFKPPFCISRTVSACAKVVKFDVMHVNTRLALALQVARSRQFHDNLMI